MGEWYTMEFRVAGRAYTLQNNRRFRRTDEEEEAQDELVRGHAADEHAELPVRPLEVALHLVHPFADPPQLVGLLVQHGGGVGGGLLRLRHHALRPVKPILAVLLDVCG